MRVTVSSGSTTIAELETRLAGIGDHPGAYTGRGRRHRYVVSSGGVDLGIVVHDDTHGPLELAKKALEAYITANS